MSEWIGHFLEIALTTSVTPQMIPMVGKPHLRSLGTIPKYSPNVSKLAARMKSPNPNPANFWGRYYFADFP
jgi:hypothetical protein